MLLGLSISELILPTILLLNIILFIFKSEFENFLKHFTNLNQILTIILLLTPLSLLFVILLLDIGLVTTFYSLLLVIITGYIFLIGFCSHRKYIYGLAIILLFISFTLNIVGFTGFASYTIVLFYLTIVLGILKDLFYAQIFEN